MRTIPIVTALAALGAAAAAPLAGQDHRDRSAWKGPAGWRLDPDRPAPDSVLFAVSMPPGWHVTFRGPGATLGDTAWRATGHYTLEMEAFLFPGTSQEGYGLFLGGRGDGAGAEYLAVLLRRDGSAGVFRRAGGAWTAVADWSRHEAVKAHPGEGTAKNLLRVEVHEDRMLVKVNGVQVAELPAAAAGPGGSYGLRIGDGIDIHVTRVDHTPMRHGH